MNTEVVVFTYSKINILLALFISLLGASGVWIFIAHTPPTTSGKAIWGLLTAYPFMIAIRALYRLGDKIVVTEQYVARQGWVRKARINWDEVIKVARYTPIFEDDGIKIISASGQVIVITKQISGFSDFFGYVKHRAPDKFSKALMRISATKPDVGNHADCP
jgi:hypothetical protein